MSHKANVWAWDLDDPALNSGAMLVLVALADAAWEDTHFSAIVFQETLMRRTRMSVDSLQRRIKELAALDYLHVVRRRGSDGRPIANQYILLVDDDARNHARAHGWLPQRGEADRSIERTPETIQAAGCGMDHAAPETPPYRTRDATMPQLCGASNNSKQYLTNTPLPPRGDEGGGEASLSEKKNSADAARLDQWERFRKVWPFDASELVGEARGVFLQLSDADQALAIDGAPLYVAACKMRKTTARNHGIVHAKRWLSGEGWLSLKARSVDSAASLGGAPFLVERGSRQAGAWAAYELAVFGAVRLKFWSHKDRYICSRPTEWPPPIPPELRLRAGSQEGAAV